MAKSRSLFICQSCAAESPRWSGQCASCGAWNTLVETVVQSSSKSGKTASSQSSSKAIYLSEVTSKQTQRVSSGIGEFDRVLGGGFVPGQVCLLAGEPGIGKSTLLTQLAKSFKNLEKVVAYVGGEESPQQIKLRAERMGYHPDNLLVIPEINLEVILATLENSAQSENISLIIVDSVQTLNSDSLTGVAGSVGQVRQCAQELTTLAKSLHIPIILVGHVTKEGTVAGPKVLEHIVDTVLYLEGDSQHLYRLLKTAKNRFGAVSEVGMFEMQGNGLVEVTNPSDIFLSGKDHDVPGTCVTVVMEGYRPILFEVQALTVKTAFGYPRRTTSGINANRLQVLIATLEKRANLNLSNHDVYVNVVGGFKVSDYAVDLAVCLAIASSLRDKPVKSGVAAIGECGLLGEIRQVSNLETRIKEAKKLGFSTVLSPKNVRYLSEAIQKAL